MEELYNCFGLWALFAEWHALCQIQLQSHVVLAQLVCIAQEDYWHILNHVEKNMHKVEEEGEIVMVKEHRELDHSGTCKGHIVIKVRLFFFYEVIANTKCLDIDKTFKWRL